MADPVVHLTNGVPDSGTGNITTLGAVIAALPAALGASGGLKVDGSGTALPVSGTVAISGTVAVSIATAPVLVAGAAVIGKVGIDQTTDGTTNAIRLLAETTKVIGTVNPGNTANTTPWLAKIGDGTNSAAIKAASTAPVATDPALVVAISPNSVNANGATTASASAPTTLATDQATLAVAFDTTQILNGKAGVSLTPTKVKISVASATTTTLVALVSTKKIRILSLYLVSAAANTVTLQSHTTTTNSDGGCSYAANGGISLPFNPIGWFDSTAGEALDMVTSGAGQVSGQLTYVAV